MSLPAKLTGVELSRELLREFRLKNVTVEFGSNKLELLKVADLDELLEDVTDADQIPFWAELWPASIGLTRYIYNNCRILQGKSVLELGAGIGLAGIAAKLAGAELLQTDYAEAALRFIRVNSLMNGLSEPQLLLADWRSFPETKRYDFIIGADILYEKTLHQDLAGVIERTVKPNGTVWLADPGRDYALEFILLMMDRGWSVRQVKVPVIYEKNTHQIDIYQLQTGGTGNE